MLTDPIADMLTRIRNAHAARKPTTHTTFSNLKKAVLDVLVAEKFLQAVHTEKNGNFSELKIELDTGRPLSLKRVSTPGRRVYRKATELKPILNGLGIAIVSTSAGVLTDKAAKKQGLGGEVICEVY